MFEAFGTTSPKGPKGPQAPQRSETQRAIDAQRGLDPAQPHAPSLEAQRALRARFEAELAAARDTAPVGALGATAGSLGAEGGATSPGAPVAPTATGLDPLRLGAQRPAAPRATYADDEPSAPESGFVLPFGWVAFLCLQLGLFAVAFGLGALTAGGRPAAAAEDADLALDEARSAAAGASAGQGTTGARAARGAPGTPRDGAAPPRPPSDQGVRGTQPAPGTAAANGAAASKVATDDPYLIAFLDPTNQFTVQVASYDGSPNGQGMALHWLAYLRARDFPAVLRQVGTRPALFVGASPNSLEMDDVQRRVHELRDERGARIFDSPRVVSLKGYR